MHPYRSLADHCFWRRAHAVDPIDAIDPLVSAPFAFTQNDRVASAGSCFAQNIARLLQASGYHYMVTEPAHPLVPADTARLHNYGVYTARYGNQYTARQLLQLLKRAYGQFKPIDEVWKGEGGRYFDPYRPTIEPEGFSCQDELMQDRERHFAAVRHAFENCDVFIFTFGLTEAFVSAADGAVYPLCPGVAGGVFNRKWHSFKNFTAQEVASDFLEFVDLIRTRNKGVKIITTVSPVPLVATAENRSVIMSNAYSKAALRVACETISQARRDVAYFPAYEIVTTNSARGGYFAEDNRSVTPDAVAHVMKIFKRHFMRQKISHKAIDWFSARRGAVADQNHHQQVERLLESICDEEALDEQGRGAVTRADA